MIKLCLSDVDNTLIPFGHLHPSPRTVAAIHACLDAGVYFGPASGRDRGELAHFFNGDERCYDTAVLVNGQKVYKDGEVISSKALDRAALNRVEAIISKVPHSALITYRDDTFGDWVGDTKEGLSYMYEHVFMHGGQRHETLPLYPAVKAGIICIQDEPQFAELTHELQQACPELDFMNTVRHWLDVVPHGWTKVNGIRVLCDYLGIQTDEVCIFGDAENDLAMMREFPYSCAVANATPEVIQAAHYHIPASADDGVAWALEQIAEAARASKDAQSSGSKEELLPAFMREG